MVSYSCAYTHATTYSIKPQTQNGTLDLAFVELKVWIRTNKRMSLQTDFFSDARFGKPVNFFQHRLDLRPGGISAQAETNDGRGFFHTHAHCMASATAGSIGVVAL